MGKKGPKKPPGIEEDLLDFDLADLSAEEFGMEPGRPGEDGLHAFRKDEPSYEQPQSPPLILTIIFGALFYAAPFVGYLLVDSFPNIPFTLASGSSSQLPDAHLNFNLIAYPIAGLLVGMASSLILSIHKRLFGESAAYGSIDKIFDVSSFLIPVVGLMTIGYIVLNQVLGRPAFGIIPSYGVRSFQRIFLDCMDGLFRGILSVFVLTLSILVFCWVPFCLGMAAIAALFGDLASKPGFRRQ